MRGAVLIAGPTCSGKSALAVRIAREIGGAVVNTDSMQVYRDLRVLTARPSVEEESSVPHRLFGHVDGATNHSVGRWLTEVTAILTELDSGSLVPVFAGGTGLYFKALTEGLSELPPVPDDVREDIRKKAEGRATSDLHAELAGHDPGAAAAIRPSDRLRVLRALEVFAATGRSILAFQGRRRPALLADRRWEGVFLTPERADLRVRIDHRFLAMMEAGALEEVRALAARKLDPVLPVMRAHGVPALLAHLRGELTLDQAVQRGQADTRAYAKRQFTWFRNQMADWTGVAPANAATTVRRLIGPPETLGEPHRKRVTPEIKAD